VLIRCPELDLGSWMGRSDVLYLIGELS
jgi:hypothetical protein